MFKVRGIKLLIIFLLSWFFTVNVFPSEVLASNAETRILQTVITLQNTTVSSLEQITLKVPLINQNTTYQRVVKEDYNLMPEDTVLGSFENRKATFTIDNLGPGEKSEVIISYHLDLNRTINSSADSVREYLAASEKIESDHPEIISLANKLTEDKVNDYEKAQAIYEFVRDYIKYNSNSPNRNKGALNALKTAEGVCENYAALFVALSRAADIPARQINGFADPNATGEVWDVSIGEIVSLSGYRHSWAEFYDGNRWVVVDPTFDAHKKTWDFFDIIPAKTHIIQNYYDQPLNVQYQGSKSALKVFWQNQLVGGDI
ncbi:MAG: transglutaminase domain-containing protein [Syntrophomonadaceae bacterium]|nr:transglutaminase domain-containing protein [Syntrophomonadaceae bacterium]